MPNTIGQVTTCENALCCTPIFQIASLGNTLVRIGSQVISGSSSGGIVTFPNEGFVPAFCIVTVKRGTGNLQLFATVREGSISASGFIYDLSGTTDATDYVLDFLLLGPQAIVPFYFNSFNIPQGAVNGTVTGLNLPFFPGQVITTVLRNSGNELIWATTRGVSTDGFSFDLSGMTDTSDYVLDYIVIPAFLTTTQFPHGSTLIPNNSNSGNVTGLNLPATPCQVLLQVKRASGSLLLYPDSVAATVSRDGFSYTLNGVTDAADYTLDWMLIPCTNPSNPTTFSVILFPTPNQIANGDPVIAQDQWQTVFLGLPPNTPPADEDYFLQVDPSSGWQDPGHTIWNTFLKWSYPPSMLTTLQDADILIQQLYIQRSSVALNMPNPMANLYAITSLPPAALSDPNWTTIFSGAGFGANPPTTFTDTTVPSVWFAYRIIVVVQPAP